MSIEEIKKEILGCDTAMFNLQEQKRKLRAKIKEIKEKERQRSMLEKAREKAGSDIELLRRKLLG
jgi:hypothetical protein